MREPVAPFRKGSRHQIWMCVPPAIALGWVHHLAVKHYWGHLIRSLSTISDRPWPENASAWQLLLKPPRIHSEIQTFSVSRSILLEIYDLPRPKLCPGELVNSLRIKNTIFVQLSVLSGSGTSRRLRIPDDDIVDRIKKGRLLATFLFYIYLGNAVFGAKYFVQEGSKEMAVLDPNLNKD